MASGGESVPGDGNAELVQSLFADIARHNVLMFVKAVTEDRSLAGELALLDKQPDTVAAFARAKGFTVEADDLSVVLEECLAARLTPAEMAHRRRYLARRANGLIPAPRPMHEETPATLSAHTFADGFVLDRGGVLAGNVTVLRRCGAIRALTDRLRQVISEGFGVDDLDATHRELDPATFRGRGVETYETLKRDPQIPGLVDDVIRALGLAPERVLFEWPGFRLVAPESVGGHGLYRATPTGATLPHRDTWWGGPQHLINVWGPIRPLPSDATLRILTRYFRRSVDNSSTGYDMWLRHSGLMVGPEIREPVEVEGALAPPLDVGDVMIFAGHQLHASARNLTSRTRVSFEFRLLHRDDADAPYAPPNVDAYGLGEYYQDWFDHTGTPVAALRD